MSGHRPRPKPDGTPNPAPRGGEGSSLDSWDLGGRKPQGLSDLGGRQERVPGLLRGTGKGKRFYF